MNVTVNNKPVETGASTLKELALQLGLPEKASRLPFPTRWYPAANGKISL